MSRRAARRAAAARPASDDDDDENDENAENGVTEMTEQSPLKQRDASEVQGGSARDRLARARRRSNEPAREDGDTEAARATAAAPAAASDGEDERGDEEEGGGQEGGESRDTAVAVPVSKARSPGRFGLGGLLKGRKRAALSDFNSSAFKKGKEDSKSIILNQRAIGS